MAHYPAYTQFHFRIQDLRAPTGTDMELTDLEPGSPQVLVLPGWVIKELPGGIVTPYEALAALIEGRDLQPLPPITPDADHPALPDNHYALLSPGIDNGLRVQDLIRPDPMPNNLVVFASAPRVRALHSLVAYSHADAPSYLVWDSGPQAGYGDEQGWPWRAWIGAGWSALMCNNRSEEHGEPAFTPDIKSFIDGVAAGLVKSHDLPDKDGNGGGAPPHEQGMSPQVRVAHRLIRFLPRHREDGHYGYNPDSGRLPWFGPRDWARHGWRDPALDTLEQDLIFESWLVPFPDHEDNKDWRLHPGALVLLYWAADTLSLWDPMPSPMEFMAQHQWSGWFGGRLHAKAE